MGLPNYKIDKDKMEETEDIFKEIRRLELLVEKNAFENEKKTIILDRKRMKKEMWKDEKSMYTVPPWVSLLVK